MLIEESSVAFEFCPAPPSLGLDTTYLTFLFVEICAGIPPICLRRTSWVGRLHHMVDTEVHGRDIPDLGI